MANRAVFLDKDGTLVENVAYNADPALVRLAAGSAQGLKSLQAAGYRLVVVSNQSGVARGLFDERSLDAVFDRLRSLIQAESGVALDGVYYCPHHPDGSQPAYAIACDCRKPAPGLLLRAAREMDIDLAASWMIGDILDDIEAGRRAGCRTILLNNGGETEWKYSAMRVPDRVAHDINEAASYILSVDQTEKQV